MSHNTDAIVHELHVEFESMLNYVKDSQTATADQVERGLFRRLLSLGARLMLLFFALRTAAAPRGEHRLANGETLPYWAEHRRHYFSIFGKLAFWRPYFYRQGVGGRSPLDQELALGADCYSDLVRDLVEYLGVGSTYAKVADCFARILGLELSTQAISDMVAEDARDVEAFYAQQPPPPLTGEAALLIIQADGKGVPMVRATSAEPKVRLGKGDKHSRKKEAVVTGLYTIAPQPRTPAAVVASLFHPERTPVTPLPPRAGPQHKRLWATMAGKDAAFERLARQVTRREGPHIQQRVALTASSSPSRPSPWCWTSSMPTRNSGTSPTACSAKPQTNARPGSRLKPWTCCQARRRKLSLNCAAAPAWLRPRRRKRRR
jgi:hypothetical protein